jgi:hypothetical protein
MDVIVSALFVIILTTPAATGSTRAGALAPLPVQEIAPGVFAHAGASL